jgi:hypothetical protein
VKFFVVDHADEAGDSEFALTFLVEAFLTEAEFLPMIADFKDSSISNERKTGKNQVKERQVDQNWLSGNASFLKFLKGKKKYTEWAVKMKEHIIGQPPRITCAV